MARLESAASEVESFEAKGVEWDAERAQALAELEQVEAQAGSEMLADASAMDALAGRMGALRTRADLAGRAAAEARRRAQDARVAGLLAQADALSPAIARARKACKAHEVRVAELLEQLEECTGAPWLMVSPGDDTKYDGPRSFTVPASWHLDDELRALENQQAELRSEAARVAADGDYVAPLEQERRRHQADWQRVVAEYRQRRGELDSVNASIEATPEAEHGHDHVMAWEARAEELRDALALFPGDVDFFRGQMAKVGDSLDEREVSGLLVEFGLAVPADEAAEVA